MLMRVLWFSVTPSLYSSFSNSHNGGGWIASLENIVRSVQSISLGVAFKFVKVMIIGLTLLNFKNKQTFLMQILNALSLIMPVRMCLVLRVK